MTLVAIATGTMFVSCSSNDDAPTEPARETEDTTYEVSLSLAGEYTDVSEEPLGRADAGAPKKYYGVNVYCMKTDGSESSYSKYAFGVFDNAADMTITLLGGYKYKFECTSVKDEADSLFIQKDYNDCFLYPFGVYYYRYNFYCYYIKDINKFITSQTDYLRHIKNGKSTVEGTDLQYPRMDRFYGELEDFVPSDGATASIPMKRTAFGIKVIVNGVPDGNLTWTDTNDGNYGYLRFDCEGCTGTDKSEYPQIFTFENVYDCWKSEEVYTKDFTIYFTWTRANGYKQYFNESITVKRNVMTSITVNLKGGANDVTIGVNEDETPMGNEDISIEYDGGNLNVTPVDPQE